MKPIKRIEKPMSSEEEGDLYLKQRLSSKETVKEKSVELTPQELEILSRRSALSPEFIKQREEARKREGAILSDGAKTSAQALALKSLFPDMYKDFLNSASEEVSKAIQYEESREKEADEYIEIEGAIAVEEYEAIGCIVYSQSKTWYGKNGTILKRFVYPKPVEFKVLSTPELAQQFAAQENQDCVEALNKFVKKRRVNMYTLHPSPQYRYLPTVSFETTKEIQKFMSDKVHFKAYAKCLHEICLLIVSKQRREFFASNDRIFISNFDSEKLYKKVKREFLGNGKLLVPTSKQIASRVARAQTRSGLSIFDRMTKKEREWADKFVDVQEAVVRRCGTSIQEVDPDVANHPDIVKIVEREKANRASGRKSLKKV